MHFLAVSTARQVLSGTALSAFEDDAARVLTPVRRLVEGIGLVREVTPRSLDEALARRFGRFDGAEILSFGGGHCGTPIARQRPGGIRGLRDRFVKETFGLRARHQQGDGLSAG